MQRLLNSVSYPFHPIGMALLGSLIYFWVTPRFFPLPVVEAKLLAILMLSVFMPLIFLLMMKKTKLMRSLPLKTFKAERFMLLFYALLLLTVNNFILSPKFAELYYFFEGLLLTATICFFLTFSSLKVSLHTAGISAILAFIAGISMIYSINLTQVLAALVFITGWVVTSRLTIKGRIIKSLIAGAAVGMIPQILFVILSYYRYRI